LLEHLDRPKAASAVWNAVVKVLKEGKVRTPDLGGSATTTQMGDAVLAVL
jgi:isocitrate/isopropylmalate dehydrogenase